MPYKTESDITIDEMAAGSTSHIVCQPNPANPGPKSTSTHVPVTLVPRRHCLGKDTAQFLLSTVEIHRIRFTSSIYFIFLSHHERLESKHSVPRRSSSDPSVQGNLVLDFPTKKNRHTAPKTNTVCAPSDQISFGYFSQLSIYLFIYF